MSEIEQRREQLPGAVAGRLPSARALKAPGAAQRGDGDDAARAARVRRNAWLLAGCAVFVYVGYIAWMFFRAQGG